MPRTNLPVVRSARGLSQSELAQRAHVSRVALSMFENGHVELPPDARQRIAAALGVPEEVAFGTPDRLLTSLSGAVAN